MEVLRDRIDAMWRGVVGGYTQGSLADCRVSSGCAVWTCEQS